VQLLAIGPGAGEKKQECAATGFLVNAEGYILTNAHVVDDARRCLASSPGAKTVAKFGPGDGRTVQAVACDVVAMDVDHDLAILKTEAPLPPEARGAFLRLDDTPVPDGARVTVTGHPSFTWQPKTYGGRVIGREALALNDRSNRQSDVLIVNVPLQRGASGSPVYLESGGVVGIVERQRPSRREDTVAVPVGYAIRLLDLHGIRWHAAH
jgi:serine protease Do